jgi:hypothetical protein
MSLSQSPTTHLQSPSASAQLTTPPTPTPTPTAAPEAGLAWNRVDDPDLVSRPLNGSMHGVIAGGPGAIAWGSVHATGPRIWTTADGLDWTRATVEVVHDADAEYPASVSSITSGGPGFVAVGGYARDGWNTSVVWTSVDGMTWHRVANDPVFARSEMDTVVTWKGELLAFGCALYLPMTCIEQLSDTVWDHHSRIWASSDGLTWEIIQPSLPSGVDGAEHPVLSTDRLWAVAARRQQAAVTDAALPWLTSTDGRTWVDSDLPMIRWPTIAPLYPLADATYTTVRSWPLPATQFTPPPKPAGQLAPGVYMSTDLKTWTPRSRDLTTVGEDLIAVGDTLIMVGDDAAGNVQCWAECQATGWRSVDGGVTWEVVPADKVGGTMTSVAALPDGTLVAVGSTLDDHGWPSTAAWVSPTRSPLGCVSGEDMFTEDSRGENGDPVGLTRAAIGGIKAGDSVALESQDDGVAKVVIVRGSEQIGFVQFERDSDGGWLLSMWSLCAGLAVN